MNNYEIMLILKKENFKENQEKIFTYLFANEIAIREFKTEEVDNGYKLNLYVKCTKENVLEAEKEIVKDKNITSYFIAGIDGINFDVLTTPYDVKFLNDYIYTYKGLFIELRPETIRKEGRESRIDYVIFESMKDLTTDYELNIGVDYAYINTCFWNYVKSYCDTILQDKKDKLVKEIRRNKRMQDFIEKETGYELLDGNSDLDKYLDYMLEFYCNNSITQLLDTLIIYNDEEEIVERVDYFNKNAYIVHYNTFYGYDSFDEAVGVLVDKLDKDDIKILKKIK